MPLQVTIDSTTWAALALTLTIIGAALTWVAWRRRGLAAGIRGLAWTLVPVAAWLTGTLKLAVNIVDDVASWASRLVFSPTVWLGVIVAGASAGLFVVSGVMRRRGVGVRGKAAAARNGRARGAEGRQAGDVSPEEAGRRPRRHGRHRGHLEEARHLIVTHEEGAPESDAARHQLARRLNLAVSAHRRPRHPDDGGRPGRVRRQRRRPHPRAPRASPCGSPPSPCASPRWCSGRSRRPGSPACSPTRCARHCGWCARESPTTW